MLSYSEIFNWSHFGRADVVSCAKAVAQKVKIKIASEVFMVDLT
jgi:hypothetical protein